MPSALSFPDHVRRLRLEVASQPDHLDEVCRAFRSPIGVSHPHGAQSPRGFFAPAVALWRLLVGGSESLTKGKVRHHA